ncbi:MAG: acetyl-CoA C-acyltransferase, partial [Halieaceae bacterium]|nr:acetyl-CoA C-acyltransferase [Halieaceae bacterium]
GKLEPSFKVMGENYGFDAVAIQRYPQVEAINHIHHAGNSSGIVDGASAVLLGNAEAGKRLGLTPRARIITSYSVGTEPCLMLAGPAPSAQKALARAGLTAADIDLWEINEAFAVVVMAAIEDLGLDPERVNVDGGAVALGHPIGASGARTLVTLLNAMKHKGAKIGIDTLCIGGGEATAVVVELI